MTRCRLLLLTLILVLALSFRAEAASFPLIVQIPQTISVSAIAVALRGTVVDSIPGAGTYLLNVPVVPLPAVASQLGIQWMELNKSISLPRFGQRSVLRLPGAAAADWYKLQPAMQLINAPRATGLSTGRAIVVADINSQVDYAHRALAGHLTSGYDFVGGGPGLPAILDQSDAGFLEQSDAGFLEQSDAGFLEQSDAGFLEQSDPAYLDGLNPAYSHGSVSAGIIAAIAPDSLIMPLRVFGDDGQSEVFTVAKAIRYAVDHGAQIINMNFGILYPSLAIQSVVGFAQASNVCLVAPAGNNNTSQAQYPAAFQGVITAAASDLSDTLASFSNYGSYVFAAAPGVHIISVYPRGYYSIVSGTSLSSAMVAGMAALIRSLRMNGVSDSIARTAVNIDSQNPTHHNQIGYGRVDAFAAVSFREPTTTTLVAPAVTYNANGLVTVTVASAAGTPTGNVTLTVDNAPPQTAALNNGTAAFTIPGPKAGDHALSAAYAAQGNFAASSAAGNLHVDKATPLISWNNPAPIEYATPLSATQLNATASGPPSCVTGTFTYSPPSGTVLTLGPRPEPQNFYPWTLSATFAPADVANCNPSAVKTVTIIVQDTIPPVTSVTSQNPAPNANGWNNTNVTVGLTALKTPYIGSGVKNITVTLSGAMTGTSVVNGNTVTVAVTTSGTTTVTYFATDNVGNKETAKTLVVKVDKNSAEAYNQFDPATKTVKLLSGGSVSGIANNPIVGVCTPSAWTKDNGGKGQDHADNNENTHVQLCTYTITSLAGNKLVLVEKVKSTSGDFDKGDGKDNTWGDSGKDRQGKKQTDDGYGRTHEVQIYVISMQYNNGVTVDAPYSLEDFVWTLDKAGALRTLTETIILGNGKTRQEIDAVFDAKLNNTKITVTTPGQTGDKKVQPVVQPGLVLPYLAIDNGTLLIEY